MDSATPLDELPSSRRATIVLILGALWALSTFATDLFLPAMPAAAKALGASESAMALNLTAVLVGLGVGQLLAGPISDGTGRRPVMLAGLVVFTLSALACMAAASVEVLIGVRLVQGLAAAFGYAVGNAFVTDHKRGSGAARLLSWVIVVGATAPVVASLSGAQMLRLLGWRGPFLLLAAVGLLTLVAATFGLPESLPKERRLRGGAGTAFRTMMALSRDARFMGYSLTSALVCVVFFAYLAGSSFVYQGIYGVSATTFSILFAVNALGMLAAGRLNHRLLGRFSPKALLAAVLVAYAVAGVAVLLVALSGGLSLWAMAVPLFVIVAGLGFIFPDLTALALSLHPEAAGTAAAYFGALRLALGALATPLVGVGGGASPVPMGILTAAASVAALVLFLLVSRRAGEGRVLLDLPEEAASEVPVA